MTRRRATLARRLWRAVAGTGGAAALISFYVWLVARTTRWTVIGREGWDRLVARPGGVVCVTWHGRMFMSPAYVPPGKRAVAMISTSRDGDLIAAIVRRWGVAAVRGSTHDHAKRRAKGGARAYASAARELRENGALIAITPDGPRGPRMRARDGAARLALTQGVPVIAVAFSVRWGWHLASWDRFLLPLPFGRGAIVYSEPRLPPEDKSQQALARFREALEEDLRCVTDRADDICGRGRVLPAESGPA
ncbi:MAG: lysophospholipid acyltransferase family protein [Paracoccaceae bacterium]